jgi:hypothetical protein
LAIAGAAILMALGLALTGCGNDSDKPATVTPENRGIGGAVPSQLDEGSTSDGSTAASGKGGKSTGDVSGVSASTGATASQGGAGQPPKQVTIDPGGLANASKGKTSKLSARTFTIIKVLKGDRVKLSAKSDVADTLHVYGYEHKVPLPAGKTVKYSFKANKDGLFVIQFDKQGINVGELRVSP